MKIASIEPKVLPFFIQFQIVVTKFVGKNGSIPVNPRNNENVDSFSFNKLIKLINSYVNLRILKIFLLDTKL
jgi:hypothetical protein